LAGPLFVGQFEDSNEFDKIAARPIK